jgi:CrcB protein
LGAIAGVLCRYYVGQELAQFFNTSLPVRPLLIHFSGCFLMGFLSTLITARFSTKLKLAFFINKKLLLFFHNQFIFLVI